MKIERVFKFALITIIIVANIGCDQVSKNVIRSKIEKHEIINVIGNNFVLMNVENEGAAMSVGADLSPVLKLILLQAIPLAILAFLFKLVITHSEISQISRIGLAFIIGGGVGNIYDRIAFGSVTDFMYIKLFIFQTGIFNIADVSVVIGTILLIVSTMSRFLVKNKLGLS